MGINLLSAEARLDRQFRLAGRPGLCCNRVKTLLPTGPIIHSLSKFGYRTSGWFYLQTSVHLMREASPTMVPHRLWATSLPSSNGVPHQ